MGGDLPAKPDDAEAPIFTVYALRDPIGANLERIQTIKGWLDKDGNTQGKVYDVVWAGGLEPGTVFTANWWSKRRSADTFSGSCRWTKEPIAQFPAAVSSSRMR